MKHTDRVRHQGDNVMRMMGDGDGRRSAPTRPRSGFYDPVDDDPVFSQFQGEPHISVSAAAATPVPWMHDELNQVPWQFALSTKVAGRSYFGALCRWTTCEMQSASKILTWVLSVLELGSSIQRCVKRKRRLAASSCGGEFLSAIWRSMALASSCSSMHETGR